MFSKVEIHEPGLISGEKTYAHSGKTYPFRANISLFIIEKAWHAGVSFEDLCDGFGAGFGTHGDWSAIRDSSTEAKSKMLERAFNHFFGDK